MLFNSLEFAVLLCITFVLYYGVTYVTYTFKHIQVVILLIASSLFYAWEIPSLLLLLFLSAVGNSICALKIERFRNLEKKEKAKAYLWAGVVLNLLTLAVFKYASLVLGMFSAELLGSEVLEKARDIPLPVGISFYTFQGISLLVDVWRGDLHDPANKTDKFLAESNLVKTRDISFYIAFFPQLVAGPIVKAREFIGQIKEKHLNHIPWPYVIRSLTAGYFLKMVVADNLSEQTVILTSEQISQLAGLDLIFLIYGYSFQIFADFAGYSLIAIGLGAMFGYHLPVNFNFPYISTSVTEFWRRWHISLSSWLKEYLYIPLGGNRINEKRTYINLFSVMFLGGLWHGAAWKFAIWGSLHGVLLAIERLLFKTKKFKFHKPSKLRNLLGWVYTFNAVTLLWITFLMPDMQQIHLFFQGLTRSGMHMAPIYVSGLFGLFVVLYHAIGWVREHRSVWWSTISGGKCEAFVYGAMFYAIVVNAGPSAGFIYFQF